MSTRPPASPTRSVWENGAPAYAPLRGAHEADDVVIGAGITGLSTALELAERGRRVCVLEAAPFGRQGTSHRTSAHLSEHPDAELGELVSRFGIDAMRRTLESKRAALETIERRCRAAGDSCDFRRVPAWRYSETGSEQDRKALREDADAAAQLGMDVEILQGAPLPFPTKFAVRFGRQAAYHPLRYLALLAERVASHPGCSVHAQTMVQEYVKGSPTEVVATDGVVRCENLVLATHTPIGVWLTIHPRLLPWRSSCIAIECSTGVEDGLYWDSEDPYHYTRRVQADDGRLLLVGGEDRRTGADDDPEQRFEALRAFAAKRFGGGRVVARWSAEYFDSADELPYIGRAPGEERIYIATGYSGAGQTFGTAAGTLIADLISGRENPWAEDVAPSRIKPAASAATTVTELLATAKGIVADRLRLLVPGEDVALAPGEGRVVRIGAHAVAVHRDQQGELHAMSASCPHMGCLVTWNRAEQQWDCPCHGSIYHRDGSVASGPTHCGLKPSPAKPEEAAAAAAP